MSNSVFDRSSTLNPDYGKAQPAARGTPSRQPMTQPLPPAQMQQQGAQPQIPAPGFQEERANDMLFQYQGPVRQPEVYRIVQSALNSLYIPSVPEITKQVISYLEPRINQKLQSSKTSEPDLTSIITELINQNNAQIREIAKLKTMNKTPERQYYKDVENIWFSEEGRKITKIGRIEITEPYSIIIENKNDLKEYVSVKYCDSDNNPHTVYVQRNKLNNSNLVPFFTGFKFCCGKSLANEFLAWKIKDTMLQKEIVIPEKPGFMIKDVNGQRQAEFVCNDGKQDVNLISLCSEYYEKRSSPINRTWCRRRSLIMWKHI